MVQKSASEKRGFLEFSGFCHFWGLGVLRVEEFNRVYGVVYMVQEFASEKGVFLEFSGF